MLPGRNWRGPTDAEYMIVKAVHAKTKILTVKDAKTGFPAAVPYGDGYNPQSNDVSMRHRMGDLGASGINASVGAVGASGLPQDTYFVRSVGVELIGTKHLPDGIAVGGNEVWRRDVPLELGGGDLRVVDWYPDICTAEMNRLRCWADDIKWVTNEDIAAADAENALRREHKLATQQDPVGVLTKVFAEAMKSQTSPKVSEADLVAAGFVRDEETGAWTLPTRKPRMAEVAR